MKFLFKHLKTVQESYWNHLKFGIWAGVVCLLLSILSFIHAVFPFLFPGVPERIYDYFESKVTPRLTRIKKLRKQKV